MKGWFFDEFGLTPSGFVIGFFLLIFAILVVTFCGVTYGGRAYGRPTCKHWGDATGVQTKFVVLNWADSGTCFALTPSGRWVVSSNWQAFVNGSRR